jgi:hypothetical protein
MIIAAKLIAQGISQPTKFSGKTFLLPMIPKKKDTPLESHMGAEGWGMHAIPGFSLWKVLAWIGTLLFAGLLFWALWLALMDSKDLQNAVIPAMFFMTMATIALAIPQVRGAA